MNDRRAERFTANFAGQWLDLRQIDAPHLFPEQTGRDYQPTRHLKLLEDFRQDLPLFSGLSHLGYGGGHQSEVALFTGVSNEGMRDRNNWKNTISLDQEAAERMGSDTRFASLVLGGGELSKFGASTGVIDAV